MNSEENLNLPQSNAWNMFTIISFVVAAGMMAGGIYFLEASFAAKGFYSMSALMLVHTTVSITKPCATVKNLSVCTTGSRTQRPRSC